MRLRLLLIALVLLVAPMAFGADYSLNDWCFYVNSLDINHSCSNGSGTDNFLPPTTPGTFDFQHLTDNNNLGSVSVSLSAGTYNIFAIFNYDINAGGALNEYATAVGTLAIGQSYSVDGYNTPGTLYSQFASGNLDNTNHLASCTGTCTDVSAAIGFTNIVVPDGSTGTVTIIAGNTPPPSGPYIQQTDNSSGDSIFISGNVQIDGGLETLTAVSPEPGTIGLIAGGFGLLFLGFRRRKS